MSGPEWKNISKDAIELIKKMLTYEPNNRISAEVALNHTWIKKKVVETYDTKATIAALTNLRTFRVKLFIEFIIIQAE